MTTSPFPNKPSKPSTHAPLEVVVMAAGKGTRMKSTKPKVLQNLGGKPLLAHVLQTAQALGAQTIVVTGHQAQEVSRFVHAFDARIKTVEQHPQLGTGHCVQQAAPHLQSGGMTLILSGDVPLISVETLHDLIKLCGGENLALLTIDLTEPSGYGRVLRKTNDAAAANTVAAIVEHKDTTPQQQAITECYSGIMAAPTKALKAWLAQLQCNNAAGEYYLTDVVTLAVAANTKVLAHKTDDALQVAGVNSPQQLAQLERALQQRIATNLMKQGVRLADPARLDIRGHLHCEEDVEIDVNCIFEGEVMLMNNVRIGAHCFIKNATIASGTLIQPFTHIEGVPKHRVFIGSNALIGPFSRLRPGAHLGEEVHIGNFVEIKNATLGKGTKANHLAYLGDSIVGERVNYGAGAITANYDGANKHQTIIEDDVHIGSNCVLVAPLTIGKEGTIGGGSVITKSTPDKALTVARAKQTSLANWQRPQKNNAQSKKQLN